MEGYSLHATGGILRPLPRSLKTGTLFSGGGARRRRSSMQRDLPNYLRTYRRRADLTQKDLAILLGLGHQSSVSKLERRKRQPDLRVALGCQLIFGVAATKIFPGALAEVRRGILERARHHNLVASLTADGEADSPLAQLFS